MRAVWAWLEERLELEHTVFEVLRHPVPAALAGRIGWWYVFGATTLAVFIVQIVTGVGLVVAARAPGAAVRDTAWEAVAWYWHFVDGVWVVVFSVVYLGTLLG